jgi:ankyrin repeat protein
MHYLLFLSVALGISFATHAMKREAPENSEQPTKIARIEQISPLKLAVLTKDRETIQRLATSPVEINKAEQERYTPFMAAIAQGDKETVSFFLARGARACSEEAGDAINDFLIAAIKGNLHQVIELLNGRIDSNVTGYGGYTALMLASALGNKLICEVLIGAGCDISARNVMGSQALHLASWNGHADIVKILLGAKADVNQKTAEGMTPLMYAAWLDRTDVVKILLERGAEVNQLSDEDMTALMLAARFGSSQTVQVLVEVGADSNFTSREGFTALSSAISGKREDIVTLLLKAGANGNLRQGKEGWNPLMVAVYVGALEIVKILLDAGADADLMSNNGSTALSIALVSRRKDMLRELLCRRVHGKEPYSDDRDCLIKMLYPDDASCLVQAVLKGDKEAIKGWLAVGVNINEQDSKGWTPLMYAAEGASKDIVSLLLHFGAQVDRSSKDGCTALTIAIAQQRGEMVEALLKAGADVNKINTIDKFNPLMLATKYGYVDIMGILLHNGASRSMGTTRGMPLDIAIEYKQKEAIKELLKAGASVSAQRFDGKTHLTHAVTQGDKEIIELLLIHGTGQQGNRDTVMTVFRQPGSINDTDKEGWTPLMYAAHSGSRDIIDLLLQYNATLSAHDYGALVVAADSVYQELLAKLLTPLRKKQKELVIASLFKQALTSGSLKLTGRLLDFNSALVNKPVQMFGRSSDDILPLSFVGMKEAELKVARLLEDTPKPIAKEQEKNYIEIELLLGLCKAQDLRQYLQDSSKDLKSYLPQNKYLRNKYKQTVLMWAALFGHKDVAKRILDNVLSLSKGNNLSELQMLRINNKKIDRALRFINAQDVRGRTALMYAILYEHNEVAKLLIPYSGSGINLKDKNEYTALAYAAEKGNMELIKMLLKRGAKITAEAIKEAGEAAEGNNYQLALSLLGWKKGFNIFGSLITDNNVLT